MNAGFSFHGIREDFKRIVDAYPWEFCQIQYNYLDEEHQAGTEGLKYAASKGLGVIVMEPLRGGALAASPQPPAIDALWREAERRRTPAEWALRWVWNHPEVTVVLSGMNDEAQVEENLRIAADARPGSLTAAELGLVGRVGRKYREIMKVGCTGCGYCQPCPSGVDIPGSFRRVQRFSHLRQDAGGRIPLCAAGGRRAFRPAWPMLRYARTAWIAFRNARRACEIPDLLEQVVREFEGDGLQERLAFARNLFHA